MKVNASVCGFHTDDDDDNDGDDQITPLTSRFSLVRLFVQPSFVVRAPH